MISTLSHTHDPHTSEDAALAVKDKPSVFDAITELLREKPRTANQLTGLYFARRSARDWPLVDDYSIKRRLSEMRLRLGLVIDSGEVEPQANGRAAVIWRLADDL